MNRNELAARIKDALLDPWTETPEDCHLLAPITLEYAGELLADLRKNEEAAELEPEDCLPPETTPELVQEVMNCIIRWGKHQYRIDMLAQWLTNTENVCIYDQLRNDYSHSDPEVLPTDFLFNTREFPFALPIRNLTADVVMLIKIGQNSPEFDMNSTYCWFDPKQCSLVSTETPFADGIIDAKALATYIIESGNEEIQNLVADMMEDDDRREIFPL